MLTRGGTANVRAYRAVCEPLEERRLLSFSAFPFPQTSVSNQDNFSFPALAAGPDGNIWVTDSVGERLLRVKPNGSMTQFGLSKIADPVAITGGPDGNIWYVDDVLNTIDRVTPAGKITAFKIQPIGKNHLSPAAITSGSDGNLWMMEFDDNFNTYIARVTPAGQMTQFAEPKAQGFATTMIAGPDGNIYFPTDDAKGNPLLGRITPAGATSYLSMKDDLFSLAVGPNNTLWGTTGASFGGKVIAGSIEQISLDGKLLATYKSGAPQGDDFTAESIDNLVSGSDGNLWFATHGSQDQLGRMTPSGAFTELAIPGGLPYSFQNLGNNSEIAAMIAGPDGNLWYIPLSGDQVVRFNFHNTILASSRYVDTMAGTPSPAIVATFVDTAGAMPASAYKASVKFDDGTTADATIAADGHGGFVVSLTHDWPLGTSDATVTITQAGRSATAADFITAQAPTPKGKAISIEAVAGTTFSGNVADFTNVILNSLDQYQFVGVDWGDGQSSNAQLVPDGKGGVFVQASHAYAAPGRYILDVSVIAPLIFPRVLSTNPPTFPPDPFGDVLSHAKVDAGLMAGFGSTLLVQSHHATTQTYASFKFTNNPPKDLSHYHATLEWGDLFTDPEHPSVPMAIVPRAGGQFAVKVPVTFAGQGVAYYRIVINDDRIGMDDSSAVGFAYGQILVDYPTSAPPKDEFGDQVVQLPTARVVGATGDEEDAGTSFVDLYNPTLAERVISAGATLSSVAGSMFSGDVGTLSGVIPNAKNLADLHARINWGDGTTSVATFTRDAKGVIHVKGKHVYAKPGKYSIVIRCNQTIYQDGQPEYGMPDIHLPSIFSFIRVGG